MTEHDRGSGMPAFMKPDQRQAGLRFHFLQLSTNQPFSVYRLPAGSGLRPIQQLPAPTAGGVLGAHAR